jgi:predicted nucleic-acid-binding protein
MDAEYSAHAGQGGEFADGIIAFEGACLGGATFATFDKNAAKRLKKLGQDSLLLS